MILTRTQKTSEGIFGKLVSNDKNFECFTLEHAYPVDQDFVPKVPIGLYQCRRSWHHLHKMNSPLQTFEVTNVPGHSGILFHPGNYGEIDSSGCILVGKETSPSMLLDSMAAFQELMNYLRNVQVFMLTIQNKGNNS